MSQVPEHIIDRIRDSVDIVEIISRYITLQKRGKNFKSLCPFHTEKTPSFTVSQDKQIFYCFGCGAGGNVFNFLMRHEKMSFPEVLEKLSAEAGIELPKYGIDKKEAGEFDQLYRANQFAAEFYYDNLQKGINHLKEYLKKRQLNSKTLTDFRLGYASDSWDGLYSAIINKKLKIDPYLNTGLILQSEKESQKKYDRFRNRIMFPIHNLSGRVVAFGGRTLSKDDKTPKYLNSSESAIYNKSQILYGLFYSKDWIRQEEYAIMVEGYMDFLQLYQNDIKNVVATSGTALTTDHAKVIRRFTKQVILCYDADSAGIQAAIRGGQILFQENLEVKVLILPDNEDPDSYVQKMGKSAFFSLLQNAKEYFEFKIDYLEKTIGKDTVSQKTAITEELISTLVPHKDPLKFNFYARIVGQKFQIPEQTLIEEIRKRKKTEFLRERRYSGSGSDEKTELDKPLHFSGAWTAERDTLVLLIKNYEEVKDLVFEFLEEDEFLNPGFIRVYSQLKGVKTQEMKDISQWLLSNIEDQKIVSILSGELFKEIRQPIPYLKDCIEKIKIAYLQRKVSETQNRLTQITSESPKYLVLLKELNVHLNKIKEIKTIFSKKGY
jgi:DNA primase